MGAKAKQVLKDTVERAIWISLAVALVGGLLIFWSNEETGVASTVLANLGASIVTIGLVGVLYDLLLRRLLLTEMLDAVGVRDTARSFGLRMISELADFDLASLLDGASSVLAMPLDPLHWAEHEFGVIRRCARDRPLNVTVYLPAADMPYLEVLSERLGQPVGQVAQALNDAATGKLGDTWDAEPVHQGATLKIYRYAGLPTTGLLETDRVIAVEAGPLIRYRQLERAGFVFVANRSKTPMARWIQSQLDREHNDTNLSQIDERPQPPPPAAGSPSAAGGQP